MTAKDEVAGGIWRRDVARIWAHDNARNVVDFLKKHRPASLDPAAHSHALDIARELEAFLKDFPKLEN